jgi:putative ABC transport system permease protein
MACRGGFVIPLKVFLSRFSDFFRRRERDGRLDDEIRGHLDLLTAEYLEKGLSLPDARAAARRAFGGVDQMTSAYRDQRGLPVLDALALDARLAVRLLGRNRSFTLLAVLVLGLGIGVNNMLFTILNAHTIRGLPIHRADRVVFLSTVDARQTERGISYPDFTDLRESVRTLSGVAAFTSSPAVIEEEGRPPDRLEAAFVTANTLDVIANPPGPGSGVAIGRAFTDEDERPGAPRVALLSSGLWHTRYGADRAVLDRPISIDDVPTRVVGVLAERPGLPSTADVWIPLSTMPGVGTAARDARVLRVFGRLRDEARLPDARAEIDAAVDRIAREHPEVSTGVRARIVPINDRFFGRVSDPAWLAFGAVAILVVLISCANVANLMLDRSLHRTRELAIRTSLGASRRRLVRQLLIEAALLAGLGGIVGLAIAVGGVRAFRQAIPANVLPYWFDYSIDARVVMALAAVSAATVLVFGLVPAFAASRTDVTQVLKTAAAIEGRTRTARWTSVFLTIELALTVVMLANLAVGLRIADPAPPAERAIDRTDILTAAVTLGGERYRSPEARVEFHRRLNERLRAVPGTSAVSVVSVLPLVGAPDRRLEAAGRSQFAAAAAPVVATVTIGAGYFDALGLTLSRGRDFGGSGTESAGQIIVNQRFVDVYFDGQEPIGQRISLGPQGPSGSAAELLTIVGIAPTLRQRLRPDVEPIVYLPYRATAPATAFVIIRNSTDTATLVPVLRREVVALDASLPLYRVQSMRQVIRDVGWNGRLSSALLTILAAIALGLSMVGLYAVTAHAASRRAREIGVRMALGAQPGQVCRLLLRRALSQLTLGFLVGVLATVGWSRMFSTGRASVTVTDPRSLAIVAAILVAVGAIATLVPVRRATRLNPVEAIRNE